MYNVFTCARDHEFVSRCSFDVITETLSAKIFSYFPCLLLTFRKKQSRFFGLEWGGKFLQPL